MAELTPELEAALAPIANNTAQLIAVAKELRRRAEINRSVNIGAFSNQLANQLNLIGNWQALIRSYLSSANADEEIAQQFAAMLSLSETARTSFVGIARILQQIKDNLGLPTEPPATP